MDKNMKKIEKRQYRKPKLVTYGEVRQITKTIKSNVGPRDQTGGGNVKTA